MVALGDAAGEGRTTLSAESSQAREGIQRTVFSVEFYISPVSLNVAGENKPRLTSPTARRCAASTVDAPLSFAREAYSAPTTTTATALSRLAVATPAAEPGARREDRAFG
jgi:hypothetical protein